MRGSFSMFSPVKYILIRQILNEVNCNSQHKCKNEKEELTGTLDCLFPKFINHLKDEKQHYNGRVNKTRVYYKRLSKRNNREKILQMLTLFWVLTCSSELKKELYASLSFKILRNSSALQANNLILTRTKAQFSSKWDLISTPKFLYKYIEVCTTSK